jgi:hypothetical protein
MKKIVRAILVVVLVSIISSGFGFLLKYLLFKPPPCPKGESFVMCNGVKTCKTMPCSSLELPKNAKEWKYSVDCKNCFFVCKDGFNRQGDKCVTDTTTVYECNQTNGSCDKKILPPSSGEPIPDIGNYCNAMKGSGGQQLLCNVILDKSVCSSVPGLNCAWGGKNPLQFTDSTDCQNNCVFECGAKENNCILSKPGKGVAMALCKQQKAATGGCPGPGGKCCISGCAGDCKLQDGCCTSKYDATCGTNVSTSRMCVP